MKRWFAFAGIWTVAFTIVLQSHVCAQTAIFQDANNHPGQNSLTLLEEQQQEMAMKKILALNNDREKAKRDVEDLIAAVNLSCQPVASFLVGEGKMEVGKRTMPTKIYETSCKNGVGYLLETQDSNPPQIVSCFAAAASSGTEADTDEKKLMRGASGFTCQLKANVDIKATAAALLQSTTSSCNVSNLNWLGVSSTNRTEYTEVLCADGSGYVIEIPRINSSAAVLGTTCKDAAELGLKCRLSESSQDVQPLTMQTYLDALKDNGLSCEPVQLRLIGREHAKKRYVVEAQCVDHPRGIVAYLPLNGNPNPFELTDCGTAKERKIQCRFVSVR
jgi:hypothetical protein